MIGKKTASHKKSFGKKHGKRGDDRIADRRDREPKKQAGGYKSAEKKYGKAKGKLMDSRDTTKKQTSYKPAGKRYGKETDELIDSRRPTKKSTGYRSSEKRYSKAKDEPIGSRSSTTKKPVSYKTSEKGYGNATDKPIESKYPANKRISYKPSGKRQGRPMEGRGAEGVSKRRRPAASVRPQARSRRATSGSKNE